LGTMIAHTPLRASVTYTTLEISQGPHCNLMRCNIMIVATCSLNGLQRKKPPYYTPYAKVSWPDKGLGVDMIQKYPSLSAQLPIERPVHIPQGHHLDDLVLGDAILAALAPEAAVFDATESTAIESACAIWHYAAGRERERGRSYGEAASLIRPVFTPTMPSSSASATR
jgi:hypothetical protein